MSLSIFETELKMVNNRSFHSWKLASISVLLLSVLVIFIIPPVLADDWYVGKIVGLCKGTHIYSGSGENYSLTVVVPEGDWQVMIIDGPRGDWWDTSRKAVDLLPTSGTGWVKKSEAESCRQTASDGNQLPPTVNFSVDNSTLTQGNCTFLHWEIDNARAVFLDGVSVDNHGSQRVCPTSSTNYVLRVNGSNGTIDQVLRVAVSEPSSMHDLPPPPSGMYWASKDRYLEVHDQLLADEDEWTRALSLQDSVRDLIVQEGFAKVAEKLGEQAVSHGFGAFAEQIVSEAFDFLQGSRADKIANRDKFRSLRLRMESYWTNPQYRAGDFVLLPDDLILDVPSVSFPNWWKFWSDWMFWDQGSPSDNVTSPIPNPPTNPDDLYQSLQALIERANAAQRQALRSLDPTVMSQDSTGEEYQRNVDWINELRTKGQYIIANQEQLRFISFAQPDATHAQIEAFEVWSEQVYSLDGQLVASHPACDLPQTYHLEKIGDRWLITKIDFHNRCNSQS
jgi:hypothetical protein